MAATLPIVVRDSDLPKAGPVDADERAADPRYPEHARVAETVREQIVREVNSCPDVRAMNLRHQAR